MNMDMTLEEAEARAIKLGWVKKHGWRIETGQLDPDYDVTFVEDLKEFVSETDYWMHEDNDEQAYDDVFSLLDNQDDGD